jgi:hypothetical protein
MTFYTVKLKCRSKMENKKETNITKREIYIFDSGSHLAENNGTMRLYSNAIIYRGP